MARSKEAEARRRQFFAIQTAKHKKRRDEQRYKQVEPGVWIKTC